jgi:hypothetical protein
VGNVIPETTEGSHLAAVEHASITELHIIDGSAQSNGYDCGCHAIMALRAMAWVYTSGRSWFDLPLPAGGDEARDAAWRSQIASEVVSGSIVLQ